MGSPLRHLILALWNGQLPLAQAFWLYAVLYGFLANLFSAIATLAALSAGASAVLAAAIHFLPLPYNIVSGIGVWRSAGRYRGNPVWATLARLVAVIWAVTLTLA